MCSGTIYDAARHMLSAADGIVRRSRCQFVFPDLRRNSRHDPANDPNRKEGVSLTEAVGNSMQMEFALFPQKLPAHQAGHLTVHGSAGAGDAGLAPAEAMIL